MQVVAVSGRPEPRSGQDGRDARERVRHGSSTRPPWRTTAQKERLPQRVPGACITIDCLLGRGGAARGVHVSSLRREDARPEAARLHRPWHDMCGRASVVGLV